MRIIDLTPDNEPAIAEVAALLRAAFPRAWPDDATAREEVAESFGPDRLSRVAVGEAGVVLGWIGAISEYGGNAWELHPLVIRDDQRGQGIGRALVVDLEALVAARGAHTLFLGTDDEEDQTTLSGVDLYPDPWPHVAAIRNLRGHPYEFYQKLGFTIVGVMPDANGPGKPDIYMAKRVARADAIDR